MTVDLVTYCCPKDIHKTYAGFNALVDSHKYPFQDVILVRQRCQDIDAGELGRPCRVLKAEDYPDIRSEFGILEDDPTAELHTGGTRYYWKYHCCNQLIGIKESTADYIAFTDCDCVLDGDSPGNSWVDRGVRILQSDHNVFMVSPNQHQNPKGDFKTKAISQIVFLADRQRFLELDYAAPLPVNVSFGMFHFVFEGRLWRYAMHYDVQRMILGGPPWLVHHAW